MGIKKPVTQKRDHCMLVNTDTLVDDITEKVWEKIKQLSMIDNESGAAGGCDTSSVQYVDRNPEGSRPSARNRSSGCHHQGNHGKQLRKCPSCNSPDHFVRDCPFSFAKHVATRITMLGIYHILNIND